MSEAPPPPPATESSKGPDPLLGRVINDRYKILSVIARGGMGKVYRAEQSPLGRLVALKVLNPSYQGDTDPEFHKRFFLEASICAKLTHPNTVTIFDYGRTDDEIYYIAMELLEGRTLHRAIRDEAPFDPERALHISRQIARSLREAHQMGVIHRDLKPANVFLVRHGDESDFVKVLDFGLVKDLEKEGEDLTQTGLFMGSPKYMAPEQIRGDNVDGRTDVYALGVLLYEMLTGKVPFDRPNSVNILMAHVHEAAPRMDDVNPGANVPPQLQAVVQKAMAKKLEERYSGMDELLGALKEAGEGVARSSASRSLEVSSETSHSGLDSHSGAFVDVSGIGGTPSQGFPIAPAAVEPPPESRGKIVALVVGLAIVVGGATAMLTKKPQAVAPPVVVAPTPAPAPVAPVAPAAGSANVAAPVNGTLLVELRSIPEGATVLVGGRTYGPTPADVEWTGEDATAGREVTFQFQLEGFRDLTVTRTVSTSPMIVNARLDAVTVAPSAARRVVRHPTAPRTGSGNVSHPQGFKNEPY